MSAVLWLLLGLSVAAAFVFQTAVVALTTTPSLLLGVTFAAAVFLGVLGGVPRRADLKALGARDGLLVAAAGILGSAVAPAFVLANRATDVPPGAVVVFWTTAVTGGLLMIAAAVVSRRPVWVAAAVLGAAGAMGVLGNWERPSSFSLLVRYPDREAAMIAAGVLLAVAVMVIARMAMTHGRRPVYLPAAGAAFLGALVWSLAQTGGDVASLAAPSKALPYFAAGGLTFALTVEVARRVGTHAAGAAYLLTPSAITALLFVEEATGVFGPRPILLDAAGWATFTVGGAVLVALASSRTPVTQALQPAPTRRSGDVAGWLRRAGIVVAAASVAVALFAMGSPGVAGTSTGTTQDGAAFLANFTLDGYRTVGGWVVLAVALLALASWAERMSLAGAWAAVAGGATGALAYAWVRFTPLQTWISWIPSEVQHDYGTEYANIVFEPVPVDAQVAALGIASAALVAQAVYRTVRDRGSRGIAVRSPGGRTR